MCRNSRFGNLLDTSPSSQSVPTPNPKDLPERFWCSVYTCFPLGRNGTKPLKKSRDDWDILDFSSPLKVVHKLRATPAEYHPALPSCSFASCTLCNPLSPTFEPHHMCPSNPVGLFSTLLCRRRKLTMRISPKAYAAYLATQSEQSHVRYKEFHSLFPLSRPEMLCSRWKLKAYFAGLSFLAWTIAEAQRLAAPVDWLTCTVARLSWR